MQHRWITLLGIDRCTTDIGRTADIPQFDLAIQAATVPTIIIPLMALLGQIVISQPIVKLVVT